MVQRQELADIVVRSGLWGKKKSAYDFLLSPEVFRISTAQLKELDQLAVSLRHCLADVGQYIANPRSSQNEISEMVNANTALCYRVAQKACPKHFPRLCKVDLLQSENGALFIAEIDSMNKRGFGYAVLERLMAKPCVPEDAKFLPGVGASICNAMPDYYNKALYLVVPSKETYYLPGFEILKTELEAHGVSTHILFERACLDLLKKGGRFCFMDWPVLENEELSDIFLQKYIKGEVFFLMPPKPFLGSKALLALLSNASNNPKAEQTLTYMGILEHLTYVRKFLPKTYFGDGAGQRVQGLKRPLLKKSLSHGMKGVWFCNDEAYDEYRTLARLDPYAYVLQEEVKNASRELSYFLPSGELAHDWWYLRITAYMDLYQGIVADLDITACRNRHIHGSNDCLQFSAIIED